jgi:hypothetical protein
MESYNPAETLPHIVIVYQDADGSHPEKLLSCIKAIEAIKLDLN